MDVKYQIFVSSTFEDLKDERRKVIEAILNLGHIPVGMEVFQAGDESQWVHIQRRILECDYYIVIVAERYGSEQDGKSYTQMEYEFARDNGVPTAAFLLHGDARKTWSRDKVEFDKADKVNAFRDVCQQKLIKHWSNGDDLASKVLLALSELTREKPRSGWVRADSVPSMKVVEEVARLSEEKRALQARVDELSSSDTLIIPPDVRHRIIQLHMTRMDEFVAMHDADDEIPTLLDVFLATHKHIATGMLASRIIKLWRTFDYVEQSEKSSVVDTVMSELAAQNLVGVQHSDGSDMRKIYFLTDYGKDFAMFAYKYMEDASSQGTRSE